MEIKALENITEAVGMYLRLEKKSIYFGVNYG